MVSIDSVVELFSRREDPALSGFRAFFEIVRMDAAGLAMNDRGWTDTQRAMAVSREEVEKQVILALRDRRTGAEAFINPLRGRRPTTGTAEDAVAVIEKEREECRWCRPDGWHVSQRGMWVDVFGDVLMNDRVCARGNWARASPVSGIVYGDETMHNVLTLTQADLASLFAAGEAYVERAAGHDKDLRFFVIFMNAGRKSAASVGHAHLQVVGRPGRHFAYPEAIAACGRDYWDGVRRVHVEELGLGRAHGQAIAWPDLVPVKERAITAFSPTIAAGVPLIHSILHALIARGTNSWSLAAILAPRPDSAGGVEDRFRSWPGVVWRFVDRGDFRNPPADIGTMELFGTSVVASDPFMVASWLRPGRSLQI